MPSLSFIFGAILAIILSFGAGFTAGDIHRGGVDKKDQAIQIAKGNDGARAAEHQASAKQNKIEKNTLGEKDAIEQKRNQYLASLNPTVGLRPSGAGVPTGTEASFGIGGQALRLSGQDAIYLKQILTNFAAECSISEAERNEVILKYEALP